MGVVQMTLQVFPVGSVAGSHGVLWEKEVVLDFLPDEGDLIFLFTGDEDWGETKVKRRYWLPGNRVLLELVGWQHLSRGEPANPYVRLAVDGENRRAWYDQDDPSLEDTLWNNGWRA